MIILTCFRCCFLMGASALSTLSTAVTYVRAWVRQVAHACCSLPNTGTSGQNYSPFDRDEERGFLTSDALDGKLETLRSENNRLQRQLRQAEEEIESLQQATLENKRLQEAEQENKRFLEMYETHLKKLRRDLEEANKEKRDLMNRLSEIAGAKLTDKNPNVTDLSDQDRATKLAERYSELYDNEWTNAFTDLTETRENCLNEENAIVALLDVLRIVNSCCSSFSNETWHNMTDVVSACTGMTFSAEEFPTVYKNLKDVRKVIAPHMMEKLRQSVGVTLESDAKTNSCLSAAKQNIEYIDACIALCWKMTIQDPPLYMSFNSKQGDLLNKDIYRPYTHDGKVLNYVVWPTLYLHKDGPILAKGVAQGQDVQKLVDI